MKREGRQHGMVRSYRILPYPVNPRPNTHFVTRFDSPPTAGLFIKVSSKPTNHSKFTGKCGKPRCDDCHLHPAYKSKGKTKGTKKHKHWRVMDQPEPDFSGLSATEALNHLSIDDVEDEVEDKSGGQIDYHVNYSSTSGDCDWVEKDQVEEAKDEVEDWILVES